MSGRPRTRQASTPTQTVSYNTSNQIASGLITYDASGDVLNDGQNQYLYDGEGRICAVASTPVAGMTVMTGYLYDASGTRVAKGTISTWSCDPTVNGFQTTYDYVLGPGGEQVTEMGMGGTRTTSSGVTTTTTGLAWKHTNVFAAGSLIATYDNNGLHFYFNDPLGTRRAQTDYAGVLEQTCSSLPFGDGLTCSGSATTPTEHHFTGKERDSESGNDYFEARYYSSAMGRFMSPDWDSRPQAVPYADLADPQSLNLYSYVLNNPLSKADPNGHDWFYVDKMWQWQKGHTYYDANGTATKSKGYAGLLVATKTGVNAQGATTFHLSLYGDNPNKPVLEGEGFSGNKNYSDTPAIKVGNYQILGRFDPPPTEPNPQSKDNNPPAVWGYQRIDPSLNDYANNVFQAYGPMRAHLNPLDPGLPAGAYFHGQFGDAFHSEGWTHGCLSYGRDTRIIDYMADHFGNAMTGVSVRP